MPRLGKAALLPASEASEPCGYRYTEFDHGDRSKPRIRQCVLPKGHPPYRSGFPNTHKMAPALRFIYEREHGVTIPADLFAIPKDGNWLNARVENIQIRTRTQYANRNKPKKQPCSQCGARLQPSEFVSRRNVCRPCWGKYKADAKRRERERYGDTIVSGNIRFHLGKLGEPKTRVALLYWFDSYFRALRKKSTDGQYRREVAHMRRLMIEASKERE